MIAMSNRFSNTVNSFVIESFSSCIFRPRNHLHFLEQTIINSFFAASRKYTKKGSPPPLPITHRSIEYARHQSNPRSPASPKKTQRTLQSLSSHKDNLTKLATLAGNPSQPTPSLLLIHTKNTSAPIQPHPPIHRSRKAAHLRHMVLQTPIQPSLRDTSA